MYRVHSTHYAALQFNPGGRTRPGRFHPLADLDGASIPTLYAADQVAGALSETVFHNAMAGAYILRAELATRFLTRIELLRDIKVADLTGHGLRKLKLSRAQLLECGASEYAHTARWAEVIHAANHGLDGMIWVSRQFDTAKALLAFGDRLSVADFKVVGEPERLDRGPGFRKLQRAASSAGITIIEG